MKRRNRKKAKSTMLPIISQPSNTEIRLKEKILKDHVAYCDRCGYKYTPNDITLEGAFGTNLVAIIKCRKCHSTHVVFANLTSVHKTVEKVQLFTDVPFGELLSRLRKGRLSYSELIPILKSLKEPHLTVKQLLSQKSK